MKYNQDLIQHEHVCVIRFDAELYFANSGVFRERVVDVALKGCYDAIVLDASIITNIDLQVIAGCTSAPPDSPILFWDRLSSG